MFEVTLRGKFGDKRIVATKELKELLIARDLQFWALLAECTENATSFEQLHLLSTLRRKAIAQGFRPAAFVKGVVRLALVGGYTFYPLSELIEHVLFCQGFDATIWSGDYDNYTWEIFEESQLHAFTPDFTLILPPAWRYKYSGKLSDGNEMVRAQIEKNKNDLLALCARTHESTKSEVILCNFVLPCYHDPGAARTRSLASEWNSLKALNLELGLAAQSYVHICDLEFLAARRGNWQVRDDRGWFESKQPFAVDFMCDVAKEAAHLINGARSASKKVLVLDLDNTLWGGVIGDDGVNGIEIGDTSARGQCFKEFQRSIKELKDRGVLLAVCSKNEVEFALEPFEKHPDMVLRKDDFVSFKANWNPKSDNIMQMAQELNLGLDSFVFVDDNPAEIAIVQEYAGAVSCLHLGEDPATYQQLLKDARFFEPRTITQEDLQRTRQYQEETERKQLLSSATDMGAYLQSLEMVATIEDFRAVDAPRISQLINKSNQFNLTTKRRTEAEVQDLVGSSDICFAVRLKDKFGDLGLVSVVIARVESDEIEIDTWLMSCRVLNRKVEHLAVNELMRRAREQGIDRVVGVYIPTAKNQMVKDFYPRMGFQPLHGDDEHPRYESFSSRHEVFKTDIAYSQGAL